jgi:hypothetical protein
LAGDLHNYRYENLKPYIISIVVAFKEAWSALSF